MPQRCSAREDHEIAAFFDHCAAEGLMTGFPPGERATLDEFFRLWALEPEHRVLEPGCGSGRLTAELARVIGPAGEIYACDLSPGMLRLARERGLPAHVRFVCGSALAVDRPDGWFDRVICLNVFPHFADSARALREFARALRPGGQFWINHFESRESLNRFHTEAAPEVADHALPCDESMTRLLRGAGFRVEEIANRPDAYWVKAIREKN